MCAALRVEMMLFVEASRSTLQMNLISGADPSATFGEGVGLDFFCFLFLFTTVVHELSVSAFPELSPVCFGSTNVGKEGGERMGLVQMRVGREEERGTKP